MDKKIKIELLTAQVLSGSVWPAGSVIDAGRRLAQRLINSGKAKAVQAANKRQPAERKGVAEQ